MTPPVVLTSKNRFGNRAARQRDGDDPRSDREHLKRAAPPTFLSRVRIFGVQPRDHAFDDLNEPLGCNAEGDEHETTVLRSTPFIIDPE